MYIHIMECSDHETSSLSRSTAKTSTSKPRPDGARIGWRCDLFAAVAPWLSLHRSWYSSGDLAPRAEFGGTGANSGVSSKSWTMGIKIKLGYSFEVEFLRILCK